MLRRYKPARILLEARVRLAAEKLASAGAAYEFAGIDDRASAGEDRAGSALDPDAFEHGIVDAHVMRLRADGLFLIRIKDDEVSIGAHRDGSFARIETEEFCRGRGDDFDEAVRTKTLAVYAASVDKAQAVLDAGAAVGDLGEVVLA